MMTKKRLMEVSLIYTIVVCILAMTGMTYYSLHKEIVIDNVAREELVRETENSTKESVKKLLLIRKAEEENLIQLSVPTETRSDSVQVENHYMSQELWIQIAPLTVEYLLQHPVVVGNQVLDGEYYENEDGLWICFELDRLCEYHIVLENGSLTLRLCNPKEVYDKIVIVDPAEDEISVQIARDLKVKMEQTDVKVYYTGLENTDVSSEKKKKLICQAQADFYIGISMDESEDSTRYGTTVYYGGEYVSPELDAVQLADQLERSVVSGINGRACGIEKATDNEILTEAVIPSVVLKPGFISHVKEKKFLEQSSYQERVAEGIFQAICVIYEGMKE